VRDLSNLVFLVLTQALLFRTMSTVHIERLDFKSVALYYLVAGALFIALLLIQGLTSRSAVLALAAIFSNTLMIGVPLVGWPMARPGWCTLFTLISMHALVLLTFATVVLELLVAREDARAGRAEPRHMLLTVGQAVKNASSSPGAAAHHRRAAVCPDRLGPAPGGRPAAEAAGRRLRPGGAGAGGRDAGAGGHRRAPEGRAGISLIKTVVHPALMAARPAGCSGLRGMPLAVMVVAASLPVGANVFLFSQRYRKAEDLVTASVAVSTVLALLSVSLVMALLPKLPG
jgi:predicted permease